MRVSKHVYFYLGKGISSNSSIIKNSRLILVDPGTNLRRFSSLFQEIKKDGLNPKKIREIWLTHAHPDHLASAEKIQKKLKCKIICSRKAKEILVSSSPFHTFVKKEEEEIEKLRKILGFGWKWVVSPIKWLFRFNAGLTTRAMCCGIWKPLKIAKTYDEIENPEVEIPPLSGHTPDEVGIWIKKEKILITGDLLAIRGPVLNMPSSNLKSASESIRKISNLSPKAIICGHGPILYEKEIKKSLDKAKKQIRDYQRLIETHFPLHTFREVIKFYRLLPRQIPFLERWVLFFILLKSAFE